MQGPFFSSSFVISPCLASPFPPLAVGWFGLIVLRYACTCTCTCTYTYKQTCVLTIYAYTDLTARRRRICGLRGRVRPQRVDQRQRQRVHRRRDPVPAGGFRVLGLGWREDGRRPAQRGPPRPAVRPRVGATAHRSVRRGPVPCDHRGGIGGRRFRYVPFHGLRRHREQHFFQCTYVGIYLLTYQHT